MNERTGVVRRAVRIGWVALTHLVFYKLGPLRGERFGVRVRIACEELGLTFVKLGQLLSTRYDVLGNEDCKELQKLLDRVPPFPADEMRAIFQEDFGREPEACFAKFDPVPFASASIAQVYVAYLADGTKLAVKVRRPEVERHIRSDMKVLRGLARIAQLFSRRLRRIDIARIIRELEYWILLETDFKNEMRNIQLAEGFYHNEGREIVADYGDFIVFPTVHEALSSARVITMDFLEGVSIKDLAQIKGDPEYDTRASLKALMGAVLRAWMEADVLYYHGDTHPSNILIQPHGKLALLDFGILGHFEKKDLNDTRDLMLAVYTQNVEQSIRIGLRMTGVPYTARLADILRPDIEVYLEATRDKGMGFWFTEFIRIYLKHDLPLPYQLVLFGRMNLLLDGVAETIMPGTATLDFLEDELKRAVRRRIVKNITGANFLPVLYAASEQFKKSPEKVAALVDTYFNDPLQAIRDLQEALRT